ncbi:hypothetical protein K503DRAFT_764912 [Rhizopogon vinicolor AM-OR11-026]|uniref:Uncharacterized protein n=1 Tax=Rhizopogon vinicolor AM-OR11-026 TaxID=1314800 RepID=A0A1B7NHW1_9AGAM|nr:hypothetical protein K503DRAFT_764912 [Rhizopogon vinicolor AM-OR11-026]
MPERRKPYWDQKHFEDSNGKLTINSDAVWNTQLHPGDGSSSGKEDDDDNDNKDGDDDGSKDGERKRRQRR